MGSAILDVTLASGRAAVKIGDWSVLEHAISSDHRLITFNYEVTKKSIKVKGSMSGKLTGMYSDRDWPKNCLTVDRSGLIGISITERIT